MTTADATLPPPPREGDRLNWEQFEALFARPDPKPLASPVREGGVRAGRPARA